MGEVNILNPGHCSAKERKIEKVQITDMQKMEIAEMWENGSCAEEIGSLYGVTPKHIRRLLSEAGYEKEGRRSKYHKQIESALLILKRNPLVQIHKVIPDDKNLRRAVKARWDRIKDIYIEEFLVKAKEEINKIKDLIRKNPNITLKDLGYETEEIRQIEKQLEVKEKEFKTISEVRKAAVCDEWTGLYLLRGRNVLKLINNGKIETSSGHFNRMDEEIDIAGIKLDEDIESGKKRNKKGGRFETCRIIELMK